ncbi:MAG: Grx4 family monothiol glutaredoxin [Bdellovibrionota bacterium]
MARQEVLDRIKKDVTTNKIFIYMKGNPQFPACGFSARACSILNTLGIPYGHANILEDEELRSAIKEYSNWPTIPQIYIDGKFIGGSDILMELHDRGELKKLAGAA